MIMLLLLLTACSETTNTSTQHPFHVSVAEIEFNEETSSLEVALKVWPEDLEKALNTDADKPIDLDKHEKIDELIFAYLKKNIGISSDGKKNCELSWVGKELEVKHAWLYFEVKTGAEPSKFYFSNTMFFELQEDQINIFNLKFKNRRASLSFSKEKARQQLSDKDFAPIRNPFADRIK